MREKNVSVPSSPSPSPPPLFLCANRATRKPSFLTGPDAHSSKRKGGEETEREKKEQRGEI